MRTPVRTYFLCHMIHQINMYQELQKYLGILKVFISYGLLNTLPEIYLKNVIIV